MAKGTVTRIADIETSGIVVIDVLKNAKGKNRVLPGARRSLGVTWNKQGGYHTGIAQDEWKAWGELLNQEVDAAFFDDFTVVMEDSKKELDLAYPHNRFIYAFLRGHYEIALNTKTKNSEHMYIVVDHLAEAKVANAKSDALLEAMTTISNLSEEDKANVIYLYGVNPATTRPEVIKNKLIKEASDAPVDFMRRIKDPLRNTKLWLNKFVLTGLVRKRNNEYYDGTILIGVNEELAAQYLEHPEKSVLFVRLKQQYTSKIETVATRLVEPNPADTSETIGNLTPAEFGTIGNAEGEEDGMPDPLAEAIK